MSKALVSLSGGMDSAVVLAKVLSDGKKASCVGFQYGSKHNPLEREAAEKLASHYGVPFRVIDLRGVFLDLLKSDLLVTGGDVPEGHYEAESMRRTVVPGNRVSKNVGVKEERDLKRILFDGAGRPVVKTHGFAVTSYKLMHAWEWHSVDSASWKLSAAWGGFYVPRTTEGSFDYTKPPQVVNASPRSPQRNRLGHHLLNSQKSIRDRATKFLEECGVEVGEYEVVQVDGDYKLKKREVWYDKKACKLLKVVRPGVTSSLEERLKVNACFMRQAEKVLPVRHLYFAGGPMPYPLEFELRKRLLSYHTIQGSSDNKYFQGHVKLMQEYKEGRRCG